MASSRTSSRRFRASTSLFVIARNSSFTYKGNAVDIRQVGRELGVRYVLEGSVRKAGNRVRITGQLIDAATGAHLWADRFDGALEDVFDLQDRVTRTWLAPLRPKWSRPRSSAPSASQRTISRPTTGLARCGAADANPTAAREMHGARPARRCRWIRATHAAWPIYPLLLAVHWWA